MKLRKRIPVRKILEDICDDLQISAADIPIDLCCLDGYWGYCCYPHYIQVDYRLSLYNFVETLAHELQHWKDYSENKMASMRENVVLWDGKLFTGGYRKKYETYIHLPWELVAETYAQDYMQRRGTHLVKDIEASIS